jgi:hypothetical protein
VLAAVVAVVPATVVATAPVVAVAAVVGAAVVVVVFLSLPHAAASSVSEASPAATNRRRVGVFT